MKTKKYISLPNGYETHLDVEHTTRTKIAITKPKIAVLCGFFFSSILMFEIIKILFLVYH